MSITLDLAGSNKWERIYYQAFQGNPANRRIRAPLIEPFELPFLFEKHVLAVSAASSSAKPNWRTAGYLVQTYPGIVMENQVISGSPASGVDAARQRIGLNTIELVVFTKLSNQFYLWFDAVPWLQTLSLGVWQFLGAETDEIKDLLEALKVDVIRVESKVDYIVSNLLE